MIYIETLMAVWVGVVSLVYLILKWMRIRAPFCIIKIVMVRVMILLLRWLVASNFLLIRVRIRVSSIIMKTIVALDDLNCHCLLDAISQRFCPKFHTMRIKVTSKLLTMLTNICIIIIIIIVIIMWKSMIVRAVVEMPGILKSISLLCGTPLFQQWTLVLVQATVWVVLVLKISLVERLFSLIPLLKVT